MDVSTLSYDRCTFGTVILGWELILSTIGTESFSESAGGVSTLSRSGDWSKFAL